MDVLQRPTMNLADPELELIDPTPNIHSMFLHFDKTFFWSQLSSRCVVRWSKRMYSCAGICSYEGRGGLCDIALSEPLLKLRPRKDLVETLLHEMIHAYLFVTNRDQDRDGHGPNFQAHMHRINRAAGLNISIYHDFHDEVKLYQTHWWRCNGPCQFNRPHFGIVRRSTNRPPGPSEYWWQTHQRYCGGTFIKIKEPDKPKKKNTKTNVTNTNADIRKYINNNNNKDTVNKNIIQNDKTQKPVLKDASNALNKPIVGDKVNNSGTQGVTKIKITFKFPVPKPQPVVFNGIEHTIGTKQSNNNERKRSRSNDVLETVRNVWANKEIGINNVKEVSKSNNSTTSSNQTIHKPECHTESSPLKVKKIDDYFKSVTSVLKDLYGQDINVTESDNQKLKVIIPTKTNFVNCPVCNIKVDSSEINKHLDECLNKDMIEKLSKENILDNPVIVIGSEAPVNIKNTDIFKESDNIASIVKKPVTNNGTINLIKTEFENDVNCKRFDPTNIRPNEEISNVRMNNTSNLRQSDNFQETTISNTVHIPPITINSSFQEEPSCSYSDTTKETVCPCCGDKLNSSVDEHLDECLSFFENDRTIPPEGHVFVYDDPDDEFDDSQLFNATGTKLPCPCCLTMIEQKCMTRHLLKCLVKENNRR